MDVDSSAQAEPPERLSERARGRLAVGLLVVFVLLLYLPSLGGGFLNLDDPWLIEQNPIFRAHTPESLLAIWTDFSPATRFALGAEYLPVRDVSVWLDGALDGLSPLVMRLGNLSVYLGALLFLRGALRRALGASLGIELAIFLFALHPVHVESVAWLAGRKDVLALFFVAWALYVHAGESRFRPVFVPILLLFAHFSKAQSVIAIGLLAAQDLLAKRRLDARIYLPAALCAVLAAVVHASVGHRVHMIAELAGGTRLNACFTFGEIVSRYLWNLFSPTQLSVVYDAPAATHLSVAAALGYAALIAWAALGVWRLRRERSPFVLAAWLWFVVPLVPVSQIIFPLQNRMADRYLLFSVFALGLLVVAFERLQGPRVIALAAVFLAQFGFRTFQRSDLFGSSVSLFADATAKTQLSTLAPYQWGTALEADGDFAGAAHAYEEVLRRTTHPTEPARRATNNLARVYVHADRLADANAVLQRGRGLWPRDPKLLYNLAIVTARSGDQTGANALAAELRASFPDFRPGQSSVADFYSAE